jgi:hypothetical protein
LDLLDIPQNNLIHSAAADLRGLWDKLDANIASVRIDALVLGSQRSGAAADLDNQPSIRRQESQEIRVDSIIVFAQGHARFPLFPDEAPG